MRDCRLFLLQIVSVKSGESGGEYEFGLACEDGKFAGVTVNTLRPVVPKERCLELAIGRTDIDIKLHPKNSGEDHVSCTPSP